LAIAALLPTNVIEKPMTFACLEKQVAAEISFVPEGRIRAGRMNMSEVAES